MLWKGVRFIAVTVSGFLFACGSTPAVTGDDAGNDAGMMMTMDAAPPNDAKSGGDSGTYPAIAPDMPQIVDQGGAILSAPRIVTVTWDADPNAATFEAFGDAIGATNYWSATTSEYKIGAATSGNANHVRITGTPPGTMTDTALDTLVQKGVTGAPSNGWVQNDPQTVYIVYVPEAIMLTSGGSSACDVEDGYHDETYASQTEQVVYAVVVEGCHTQAMEEVVAFSTETASHELVESASDPHTQNDLAWTGFDADHWGWELWEQRQDELADACQDFDDAYYVEQNPFAYRLQRSWSNASAAAGHNPCVPLPSATYYNAVALNTQPITLMSKTKTRMTKGFLVPVGQTVTVHVELYSDAPMPAWAVSVVEGDGYTTPATPHLTITQSATSGANGDVIDVGITTNSVIASGVLTTILSTQGGLTHYMPFVVATE